MPFSMSAFASFWPRIVFSQATDLDAAAERFADAVADDRIGLQHADARPVGDDLDLDVRRAEVGLQVARVVEREIPLGRDRCR